MVHGPINRPGRICGQAGVLNTAGGRRVVVRRLCDRQIHRHRLRAVGRSNRAHRYGPAVVARGQARAAHGNTRRSVARSVGGTEREPRRRAPADHRAPVQCPATTIGHGKRLVSCIGPLQHTEVKGRWVDGQSWRGYDVQRPVLAPGVVDVHHRRRHRIAAHIRRRYRTPAIREAHIQTRGHRRRRRILATAVIHLVQVCQRHRRVALGDRQLPVRAPGVVFFHHRRDHCVTAGAGRRIGAAVIREAHIQTRGHRRRGRTFAAPVIHPTQVCQRHRRVAPADRQRPVGAPGVVDVHHRRRHRIAPCIGRGKGTAVIRQAHIQTRRHRRRRHAFAASVVSLAQVCQRHRRVAEGQPIVRPVRW